MEYSCKEHFKRGSEFLSKPRTEQLHPSVNTTVVLIINKIYMYDDNTTGVDMTCSVSYYPENYFETWGALYNCLFVITENKPYRSIERDIQSTESIDLLADLYATTRDYCFNHFEIKTHEHKDVFVQVSQPYDREEDLITVRGSVLDFLNR